MPIFNDPVSELSSAIAGQGSVETFISNQRRYDFRIAVARAELDKIRILLSEDAELIKLVDENNETALFNAVRHGQAAAAQLLMELGVDVSAKNNQGASALHVACSQDNEEVIRLLLNKGAELNAINLQNQTPMHYAAYHGQVNAITMLKERKADIKIKDVNGNTPLHFAAFANQIGAIIALSEARAEMEARNKLGYTALHVASLCSKPKTIQTLYKLGSFLGAEDRYKRTALHLAISNTKALKMLIRLGADIHAEAYEGNTSLQLVIEQELRTAILLLTEMGADPDRKNNKGISPAIHAAMRDRSAALEILMRRGFSNPYTSNIHWTELPSAIKRSLKSAGIADSIYSLSPWPHGNFSARLSAELDQSLIAERVFHHVIKTGIPSGFFDYLGSVNSGDIEIDKTEILLAVKAADCVRSILAHTERNTSTVLTEEESKLAIAELKIKLECGLLYKMDINTLMAYFKDKPELKNLFSTAIMQAENFSHEGKDLDALYKDLNADAEMFLAHYLHQAAPDTFPELVPYSALSSALAMRPSAGLTKIKQAYEGIFAISGTAYGVFCNLITSKLPEFYHLSAEQSSHLAVICEMLDRINRELITNPIFKRLELWKDTLSKVLIVEPSAISSLTNDTLTSPERPQAFAIAQAFAGSRGAAGGSLIADREAYVTAVNE